ncbi:MAG: HDOD domain-containing protein [Proteobacteria bacterium]|nr:HDOD domain-containing protein [Pseudomonadota bacterium]
MFNPQAPRPEVSTRALVFRQALGAAFKSLRQSMPAAPDSLRALLAGSQSGPRGLLSRPGCRDALMEIRARLFQIPGRDAEAQAWWEESLASAAYAARVAQAYLTGAAPAARSPGAGVSVAASFMAALLHRSGEALALKILARVELEYRMKLDSSSRREWCATHSGELAGRLLRSWNLPEVPGLPDGDINNASVESKAVYFGRLFAIELLQPELCVPGALDHAAADLGLETALVAEVRKDDVRSLIRAMA